jgi:pimeloyl-ACP methyl ester carboxylesterase
MLEPLARRAIARLAASVLSVRPLVEGVAVPIRIAAVGRGTAVAPHGSAPHRPARQWDARQWDAVAALVDRVARRAGVSGLTVSRDVAFDDLQVFERVVSDRLALAELADSVATFPDDLPADADTIAAEVDAIAAEVDAIADEAVAESFDVVFQKETIAAFDGVPLNVYGSRSGGEAVVLVPACGMPAALAEYWMRFLDRDRRVLAWESRGLFGALDAHDGHAIDVAAQAADLFTVMDHYGVPTAHVVGLCGGAVIALAAAAQQPDRISSLSLWHGAYAFADGCPRTRHQDDLIELMAIAASSRRAARSVQTAFCQMTLTSTPAELAHYMLYPFASPDLFYRYCRLNGNLATTDVGQYLAPVTQPTLVITSRDDETAHPQGSKQVADGLRNASLRIEPHGDHASLFQAGNDLMQVAVDFIARQVPAPSVPEPTVLVSCDSNTGTAVDSFSERL